jgi:hypothetical protein
MKKGGIRVDSLGEFFSYSYAIEGKIGKDMSQPINLQLYENVKVQ